MTGKLNERKEKFIYFATYTILFLVMCYMVFHYFFSSDLSFVWKVDGWTQHTKALTFYSNWLQDIAKSLIYDHKLVVPQWSACIGFGSDILTTLHYYVVGDPFNLLSVFVPDAWIGIFYSIMVLVRIYCIGIAFSAFCFYMKKQNKIAVLLGSFCYMFWGYVFVFGMHHPYFLNPLMFFPLLLIGVERVFQEKKGGLFSLMVCICSLSNFYFFYMIVALTVLYVVIRFFTLYKKNDMKMAMKSVGRLFLRSVIGLAMSAVLFLPVILFFVGTERTQVGQSLPLFYGKAYFRQLSRGLISAQIIPRHTVLCFSAVVMIAVIIFLLKKGNRSLKAGLLILTLFLMLPYAGHVLNGFSYASNRWMFGYGLLLSYIVVTVFEDISSIKIWQLVIAAFAVFAYLLFTNDPGISLGERNIQLSVILAFAELAVLFLYCLVKKKVITADKEKKLRPVILLCILAFALTNIWINARVWYSPSKNNMISEYKKIDEVKIPNGLKIDREVKEAALGDTNSFWRYSGSYDCIERNSTLLSGLYSTSSYWSLTSGNLTRFMVQQDIPETSSFKMRNLDGRTVLDAIAGVKYYVIPKNSNEVVPYGYEKTQVKGGKNKYDIYKNKNPLPLGFTYKNYILEEEYEKCSPEQRQNAMIEGVVLRDNLAGYEKTSMEKTGKQISYKLECDNGIEKQGKVYVVKKNASITLTFQSEKNCESYFRIGNMKLNNEVSEKVRGAKKRKNSIGKISVEYSNTNGIIHQQEIKYMGKSNRWYAGRHNFIFNTGWDSPGERQIKIIFETPGIYSFDHLSVYSQPLDNYEMKVNALKEDVLENVKMETNKISGDISLEQQKILCLSIPYSKGWTATVDGKETKLLEANTMFMALPLQKGEHKIVLKYRTPGLKTGLLLSTAGWISFVILIYYDKRRQKN